MRRHENILVLANRNPFTMERLLSGMAEYVAGRRYWSFEVADRAITDRRRELRREGREADGIVAVGLEPAALDRVLELSLPVVGVHVWDRRILSVCVDDVAVARQAAEHLLARGFRRFGYFGPDRFEVSRVRLDALRRVLADAGAPPPLTNSADAGDPTDWPGLRQPDAVAPWVARLESPAAVLGFNDQLAATVLSAGDRLGLNLPDDLAVVGVDNTELRCQFLPVPLTSVDPNLPQVGYQVAERLGALLDGRRVPPGVTRVEPLGVVARQSTDLLVTADPEVRAAARIIRRRACEGLTYEELMESFTISRRTLERRFRAELGRSIGDEIRRIRLEAARELLRRTRLPLADIAARTGFEYISYLSRAFKKAYGENPSAFRARSRQ